MTIFSSTLNQTAFLFTFITAGYILAKCGVMTQKSTAVLSKLENCLFIPALVMGTFFEKFTRESLGELWKFILVSTLIEAVVIPISIYLPKLITDDRYIQKMTTYGFAISNWGFMGNAVMIGLFPEIFFEYTIFTLPLWVVNFLWAMPCLLMPLSQQPTLKEKLKNLVNPMFTGMLIGMIVGIMEIPLPAFFTSAVTAAGDCMSPMAMLLTGITVSAIDLKETFTNAKIYLISLIRLVAIPVAFAFALSFIPISRTIYICAVVSISMPLGMNIVVIPSAYGENRPICSGLVIVSHLLSCITLPLILSIFL
ncbi:MAG: AEC family transporter [Oscillospiraceae bacterium]|nr:AEC family transporter [Oscillospiraceae bacterium]